MAPSSSPVRAPTAKAPRIGFLVYDGVTLLDVAGPAEVFQEANKYGADYQLVFLSPSGTDVTSNLGVKLHVDGSVDAQLGLDTYFVPGADVHPRQSVPSSLAAAAAVPAGGARRVASICTGAFVLAAAGLLDGKRATTHWKVAHELAARCPTCRVEPDAIYVRDGGTYTSAGVTAGIDLALALVEEDHGPVLARKVARALVVYMQRSGGQSQFSAPLQGPTPRSPAVQEITRLVTSDPQGDHSLETLAARLSISSRHLTRLFRDELDTTPARYVEGIRFDLARALLDQGHTATQAALLAGFPSYESLRRVFRSRLSISPAAYQRRFATARRESPAEPDAGAKFARTPGRPPEDSRAPSDPSEMTSRAPRDPSRKKSGSVVEIECRGSWR